MLTKAKPGGAPAVPSVEPLALRGSPPSEKEHDLSTVGAIESQLLGVERSIQKYHTAALAWWTDEQRKALHRAADLDRDALETQRAISEACLDGLYADLEDNRAAREAALQRAHDVIEECERDFEAQLRQLGNAYERYSAEQVGKATSSLAANGEAVLEGEWALFDVQLRTILWQHAKMIRGTSLAEGMAELYEQGELKPHLEAERKGWAESQVRDLALLRTEIEREHEEAFAALATKLSELAPGGVLNRPRAKQLTDLLVADRQRLTAVEAEVRAAYDAEIAATLVQCEEDYRGYDVELQNILLRTMQRRYQSDAHMRQLKLALCRWRLDYQRVFHEQCSMLCAPGSPGPGLARNKSARAREGKQTARQFEVVRRLVVDLWARTKMPTSEIRKFLDRAIEAATQAGQSESLAQVYQSELCQYGALPILEHADRPELLECWLQTLRDGGLPPGASKRPSIGGAGGSSA